MPTQHSFPFPRLAKSFCLVVCGLLLLHPLVLEAATCTTVASGAWSAPSVWLSGIFPQTGDTAIIGIGDSVWLDESTPALGRLVVNGSLAFISDTLYLQADSIAFDTIVTVQGTLDAGSGWFSDSTRPIVHLDSGSLFRTSAVFPIASPSIFDSNASPIFVLDSANTFEYYSTENDLIDVSYLLNNIVGHAYQNLTLTGCVASFLANPLVVMGTLHLNLGAGTTTAYTPQTITLHGDVINDNGGASGAPGAGLRGCGMLSLGQDTWIFDALLKNPGTKDTCHWTGPSQLGTVVVMPNTVLSVRFLDDTHCDSLDILTNLIEESKPCGGHLIGRAYSEISATLDSTNPVDSFFGLGLTIASGTNPYLGLTRVVRTSGYLPPGANAANDPMLRYYSITTSAGPQTGTPDMMAMQVHCDELDGSNLSQLHFWRSPDRGNTWAFSGITSYDAASDSFVWDTTVLCWPNDSGSFLWMLSDGYTDMPLPVTLQNFSAERMGTNVQLTWQTSSENNIVGYELDRDSEFIASYSSDDSLRSRSPDGATYDYTDANAPAGTLRYDLYEITDDGAREWLATQTATAADSSAMQGLGDVRYTAGSLVLSFDGPADGRVSVSDAIGRVWLDRELQTGTGETVTIPVALGEGFYLVSYRWEDGESTKKLLISP
jgi:hypothetical protein